MGILKGRQFYSWEIEPVIRMAVQDVITRRMAELDFAADPSQKLTAAHLALAGLLIDAVRRADEDSNGSVPSPVLYRDGDAWWKAIDNALTIARSPSIERAVAGLPIDAGAPRSWMDNKLLVFGGLAAALAVGYHLTKK